MKLLLKPGGALQKEEYDFPQGRHVRGGECSTVSAARSMGCLFRDAFREKQSYGWNTLPQNMKSAGLVRIEEDIVRSDRVAKIREALTANGIMAVMGWARRILTRGIPGSRPMDELEKLER